jgi:hypothetical protein
VRHGQRPGADDAGDAGRALKVLNNYKNVMLNEPLLAAIAVQNGFFSQSSRFESLYADSKGPECMNTVLSEAEALVKAESRVQNMKSVTKSPSSFSQGSTLSSEKVQMPWMMHSKNRESRSADFCYADTVTVGYG